MIKYDPLWRTLKEKGISQYQLIKDYGIDKAQLQRLRQNLVVKTLILNRLSGSLLFEPLEVQFLNFWKYNF